MFSFSNLGLGKYTNCKITVTDESGNESLPLEIPEFEVVKTSSITSGIMFNPVIKKIKCNFISNQIIQIYAEADDDGGKGNLSYKMRK